MEEKLKIHLFLLAIIVFHTLANILVISSHTILPPPSIDIDCYLDISYRMYNALNQGYPFLSIDRYRYSPLYFLISQPFYLLFGKSLPVSVLTNSFFFVILIISTYNIGKDLISKLGGLLSAAIISFYPQVFGMSRVYMLDFGLTAMVALCFSLIIKTEDFKNKKYSIFLGICMGFALFIKPQFILFIVGPLLILIISTRTQEQKKNLIASGLCFILLAGPRVFLNYNLILSDQIRAISVGPYKMFDFSLNNIFWIPKSILLSQTMPIMGVIFILSLLFFLFSKRIYFKNKLKVIMFLIVPYLFFSFISTFRDTRFILPFSIGVSCISAFIIKIPRSSKTKGILFFLIVLFCFMQFILINFNYFSSNSSQIQNGFMDWYLSGYSPKEGFMGGLEWNNGILYPFKQEREFSIIQKRIINYFVQENKSNRNRKTIFILASNPSAYSPPQFIFPQIGLNNIKLLHCMFPDFTQFNIPDYYILINETIAEEPLIHSREMMKNNPECSIYLYKANFSKEMEIMHNDKSIVTIYKKEN